MAGFTGTNYAINTYYEHASSRWAGAAGQYVGTTGASAKDTNPPVVANVNPTSGTTLAAITTPIQFDLYDTSPGLIAWSIWATISGESRPYLIHTSSAYVAPFVTNGTFTGSGTSGSPYHFSFYPDGINWPSNKTLTVLIKAIDSDGNLLSQTVGTWTTATGTIYLANTPLNTGMQTP